MRSNNVVFTANGKVATRHLLAEGDEYRTICGLAPIIDGISPPTLHADHDLGEERRCALCAGTAVLIAFSGDGRNPHPGPLTCPFATFDLLDGRRLQVAFSCPAESDRGVLIRSVLVYCYPGNVYDAPSAQCSKD